MEQKYDVFISYSRKDTEIADRICSALHNNNITFFIDRQGIGGGMEFPAVIAQAILNSKLFLFLASKNSYSSKFTINEITYAFNKKGRNQILPYIIDGSSLPEELNFVFAGINWRTLYDHPITSTLVHDILRLLNRMPSNSHQTVNAKKLKLISKDNLYGFVDPYGNEVIPCKWAKAKEFHNGMACVQQITKIGGWFSKKTTTKCGFIDVNGELAIPCIYDDCDDFYEGLAVVRMWNKEGAYIPNVINKKGNVIVPTVWSRIWSFERGQATVMNSDGMGGLIDYTGKLISPCLWPCSKDGMYVPGITPFSYGFARVVVDSGIHNYKYYAFINKEGKINYSFPTYRNVSSVFEDGLIKVASQLKWNYLTRRSEGGEYGFINLEGKEILQCEWKYADLSEGVIICGYFFNWFIYNKNGNMILSLGNKYYFVYPFHNGLSRVQDKYSKYGYINMSGELVIPCIWKYAEDFEEGSAWVQDETGRYRLIDTNGSIIS